MNDTNLRQRHEGSPEGPQAAKRRAGRAGSGRALGVLALLACNAAPALAQQSIMVSAPVVVDVAFPTDLLVYDLAWCSSTDMCRQYVANAVAERMTDPSAFYVIRIPQMPPTWISVATLERLRPDASDASKIKGLIDLTGSRILRADVRRYKGEYGVVARDALIDVVGRVREMRPGARLAIENWRPSTNARDNAADYTALFQQLSFIYVPELPERQMADGTPRYRKRVQAAIDAGLAMNSMVMFNRETSWELMSPTQIDPAMTATPDEATELAWAVPPEPVDLAMHDPSQAVPDDEDVPLDEEDTDPLKDGELADAGDDSPADGYSFEGPDIGDGWVDDPESTAGGGGDNGDQGVGDLVEDDGNDFVDEDGEPSGGGGGGGGGEEEAPADDDTDDGEGADDDENYNPGDSVDFSGSGGTFEILLPSRNVRPFASQHGLQNQDTLQVYPAKYTARTNPIVTVPLSQWVENEEVRDANPLGWTQRFKDIETEGFVCVNDTMQQIFDLGYREVWFWGFSGQHDRTDPSNPLGAEGMPWIVLDAWTPIMHETWPEFVDHWKSQGVRFGMWLGMVSIPNFGTTLNPEHRYLTRDDYEHVGNAVKYAKDLGFDAVGLDAFNWALARLDEPEWANWGPAVTGAERDKFLGLDLLKYLAERPDIAGMAINAERALPYGPHLQECRTWLLASSIAKPRGNRPTLETLHQPIAEDLVNPGREIVIHLTTDGWTYDEVQAMVAKCNAWNYRVAINVNVLKEIGLITGAGGD